MPEHISIGKKISSFILDNIVMLIFVVFVGFGLMVMDMQVSGFVNDMMSRFFRNGILVLSLIIPVMAGLGLNFGIVVGALAGMLSLIFVRYHYAMFVGMPGLFWAFVIATPPAILFGFLTGRLYNKTKGQELVTGLMVSFFAEGLYMIFILFVLGYIIPLQYGHGMVIPGYPPVGIRASFELGLPYAEFTGRVPEGTIPGLTRAMNHIWQIEFAYVLAAAAVALLIFLIVRRVTSSKNPFAVRQPLWKFYVQMALCAALVVFALISAGQIYYWYNVHAVAQLADPRVRLHELEGISPFVVEMSRINRVPMVPLLLIVAIALFMAYFGKTKLGQDCRAVGQNRHIASVAGINVDRTRIIATIFSTVLAAWGMIIFIQDMGVVATYTQQRMVGMFSVAAILVGGATVAGATVKNAIVGIILFHAMFMLSPAVARFAFDNELAAEYVRSLMLYGVIGLSLGLYVWRGHKASKAKERLEQ